MDLSMSRLSAMSEPVAQEQKYPTFAAPTPINLSRSYVGNTLTPGSLPSPLNFPSITPPSSPYSFYGLYSPATAGAQQRVSPMYDPSYLRRLKSNPIFRDLQSLLQQECSQMDIPANLITTSWNLMHLHKKSESEQAPPTSCKLANENSTGSGQKVYTRHMTLQDKLLKVRIDSAISADGLSVENDYSKTVGSVEMSRYHALSSCPSETVKATINSYYDNERLKLTDKTEEKLDFLISKAENMRQTAMKANRECPTAAVTRLDKHTIQGRLSSQEPSSHGSNQSIQERLSTQEASSQGASLLLQPMDENDSKITAVRKLKFNTSNESVEPEDEENDYLNGSVNSEDFEIDEIDVETVDTEEPDWNEVRSETTPQEFPHLSPASSEGSDLLQQCIAESGLHVDNVTSTSVISRDTDSRVSVEATTDYPRPAYNSASHSPNSPMETIPTPLNISSDSDHSNQGVHTAHGHREASRKAVQPHYDPFGTPQNFDFMSIQPDKINMALSQIGKLCSGPSITFTPELRRETSAFTPDFPGFSPLTSSYNSLNSSGIATNPAPITGQYNRRWNSSADSKFSCSMQTGSGEKRKRPCEDEEPVSVSENQPADLTRNSEVTSATDNDQLLLDNPVFKTHRMLTADATTLLNHWYTAHVTYPYPNDEEVKQLSQVTGITGRQVKKWMANKRVRCFNTLSITGNQHPIKYKYNGQGRKKKAPAQEKENCDSTSEDRKANYSLLNDDAKVVLSNWYEQHAENPYPSEEEKQQLAAACNISVSQVKSWFANKRNRSNNTKRQVPNYFINKFPEYQGMVQYVGQRREEARLVKRRKINQMNMYIQPNFYF